MAMNKNGFYANHMPEDHKKRFSLGAQNDLFLIDAIIFNSVYTIYTTYNSFLPLAKRPLLYLVDHKKKNSQCANNHRYKSLMKS